MNALLLVVVMGGLGAGCGASFNGEHASMLGASEAASQATSLPMARTTEAVSVGAVPASAPIPAAAQVATGYKIGPRDVLSISVFKVPELSKEIQVAGSGMINLPLVGEVPAAGKSARDIERDLTAKLGAEYLQSPQVKVFVKEYNSQQVTIEGAVKKPGVYPITGRTSLLQTIAMAEGLDSTYDSTILVLRQRNRQRLAAKFNIEAIKKGRAPDPTILKGDTVVVNTSVTKRVFESALRILPHGGRFVPLVQ